MSFKAESTYLSNVEGDKTSIGFTIYPGDSLLVIKNVEWEKKDTVFETLTPFSKILDNKSKGGKPLAWNILVHFPYTPAFDEEDFLIITTDKGVIRTPTSKEGKLFEKIRIHQDTINELSKENLQIKKEANSYKHLFIVFLIVTCVLLISLITACLILRRKIDTKVEEINLLNEELTDTKVLIRQFEKINFELENDRFTTLNFLCDEYFEKKGSEATKNSVYNEIEKHILSFKSPKTISELQDNLNNWNNNILIRIQDEIPGLDQKDIIFLTYLFSGFSPRAVCLFTDINMKHFYYRRNKIKEMIMSVSSPDKEIFLSKIDK